MASLANFSQTLQYICPIFTMETAIIFYYYTYLVHVLAKIWFGQFWLFFIIFRGSRRPKMAQNVKKVDSAFKNGPIVKVYTSLEPYGRVLSFVDKFCFGPFWSPHFLGAKPPFLSKKFKKKVDSAFKHGLIVKVYTSLEPYGRILPFVDNFFLARFGPPLFWSKNVKQFASAFKNAPILKVYNLVRTVSIISDMIFFVPPRGTPGGVKIPYFCQKKS